uniref:Uncharacterized protein n=1 Tax=Lutzomyia longipalpis TaxID=7200 RepID=A0A7G3B6W1_LUTLO
MKSSQCSPATHHHCLALQIAYLLGKFHMHPIDVAHHMQRQIPAFAPSSHSGTHRGDKLLAAMRSSHPYPPARKSRGHLWHCK